MKNSTLNTLYAVGVISGVILGGIIIPRGRKLFFCVSMAIGLLGCSINFIISWPFFLTSRYILGIFHGAATMLTMKFAEEYVPTSLFGVCGSIILMSMQLGILASSLLAYVLPPDDDTEAMSTTKNYYIIYAV